MPLGRAGLTVRRTKRALNRHQFAVQHSHGRRVALGRGAACIHSRGEHVVQFSWIEAKRQTEQRRLHSRTVHTARPSRRDANL